MSESADPANASKFRIKVIDNVGQGYSATVSVTVASRFIPKGVEVTNPIPYKYPSIMILIFP